MRHRRGLAKHHVGLWIRPCLWPADVQVQRNDREDHRPVQDLRLHVLLHLLRLLHLPLLLPHAQLVRRCHHGQLRLPDQRFIHPGSSPSGRVHPDLGGIWSECWVRIRRISFKSHSVLADSCNSIFVILSSTRTTYL